MALGFPELPYGFHQPLLQRERSADIRCIFRKSGPHAAHALSYDPHSCDRGIPAPDEAVIAICRAGYKRSKKSRCVMGLKYKRSI
jgi:hypothetical protein